ncbi:MAG: hypothetical protein JO001_08995 [Alphaproteobacteria bacterium]|nr:hypothetical protein [Alphaproteobacteria bacterium]
MEDEGYVDDDFIAESAWEYVAVHGAASLPLLRKLADSAAAAGDVVTAETWRAIAETASHILPKG